MEISEAPEANKEEVSEFLSQNYSLSNFLSLSSLPSYEDLNFYIETIDSQKFVFRLSNLQEKKENLELQNRIMIVLGENGICCQQPILSPIQNDYVINFKQKNELHCLARLISFIPGKMLSSVSEFSDDLINEIGRMFGKMTRVLNDKENEQKIKSFKRDLIWDLSNAHNVITKYKHEIENIENRNSIINYFLELHANIVLNRIDHLRIGVAHNDFNQNNIVICNEQQSKFAIIDFGDCNVTHIINELAIAVAHSILNQKNILNIAIKLILAYNSEFPLQRQEIEVLFPLIGLRLCTCVCISAVKYKSDPGNEYIRSAEQAGWDALRKLHSIPVSEITNLFLKELGMI
eukprot:TRINITY_DN852_c3_g1_i1.p1 TRINITY_DN852_c3_g1~~TRINITY_DN852_c3_g1_i1.p1  ORF type:complete len:363 (-),score=124.75 TRINITY_DN852_c3_g1_i1:54-1097(-)